MKKPLPRICFIGCGLIAERHARILKKLYPDIEISFASRDSEKSGEFALRLKGKHSFTGYEKALKSDLFDIAFITTPHAFHSGLAVFAADNGKHIIIEKPVTRTLKELSLIEKSVARNKVRCAVAENYYFKPYIKKVRGYIESGLIGDVLIIELNKTNRDKISGWRMDARMMGGGALLEGGVHWINALVSLAGALPAGVIAMKPDIEYPTAIPFEDSLILNVKFDNGIAGKLLHSWRIPNPLKGMALSKIYGTEGVITFESNGLFAAVYGRKKRFSFINPADFLGFRAMHKSFINSYMNDLPWEPSLERIKTEMKVIDSAYRSLKTKKIEKI